jgi:hypothetical protein
VVRKQPRRQQAAFVTAADALATVEKFGGLKGAQKHIGTLKETITQSQREVAEIEAAVETVVALKKRLTQAA